MRGGQEQGQERLVTNTLGQGLGEHQEIKLKGASLVGTLLRRSSGSSSPIKKSQRTLVGGWKR